MQICLSTRTIPSSRRKDAPVGQTSTQGGSSQCWHISGKETSRPVVSSLRSTLRIHWASVSGRPIPVSPCSSLHAETQASHPLAQRLVSTHKPQRWASVTGSSSEAATASSASRTPGASASNATPGPAWVKNRRRVGAEDGGWDCDIEGLKGTGSFSPRGLWRDK